MLSEPEGKKTDFLFYFQITIIGSMSEESIVLIDSFRYVPPDSEEPCKIY